MLDASDKDYLTSLDTDIVVLYAGQAFATDRQESLWEHGAQGPAIGTIKTASDLWLCECLSALVRRQILEIDYASPTSEKSVSRQIKPIGLFFCSLPSPTVIRIQPRLHQDSPVIALRKWS